MGASGMTIESGTELFQISFNRAGKSHFSRADPFPALVFMDIAEAEML
jgi:hypothetical protein